MYMRFSRPRRIQDGQPITVDEGAMTVTLHN
jgi:hypothetical protein